MCRYISKISKKSPILGKKYFSTGLKISKVFLHRWGHPPPNISVRYFEKITFYCIFTRGIWGGVTPPVEKYFEIFGLWRNTFLPKNEDFSKIFEILLHRSPQKSLFIAFLLTNFPKISKKVLKNFSRRLRRREKHTFGAFGAESVEKYPNFFGPTVEKSPPPL